ncbi:unnamed protein product [Cyclocybe aegerita]|uniref:Aldehyde dehydrogenase n=1 Tax=Cyclocybe aegerita TaxID=1973307 RepID=A0A8S0WSF4_CYCAE|nr:unnamed protein product [Cyclocybe aegerita]
MSDYTPIAEIPKIVASLRTTFRSGHTKPLAFRRHQLHQLARLAQENADALATAIHLDLGRPKQESIMAEVGAIVERSLICAEKVGEWVQTEDLEGKVEVWQRGWRPRVVKEAKGVVLIIAPWNYPLILALQPLYGAIAAGCCAVIKPSEISAHFSSLLATLLPQYLDTSAYKVVLGGVEETTELLQVKFDHIFYTGNARVARLISLAASHFLTPLTLELGGKSPVLLLPPLSPSSLSLAAKRIIWGKTQNAGQICVAPDYVLVDPSLRSSFIAEIRTHLQAFFPEEGGALKSKDYGRIVSESHFGRLTAMLERTRGRVVLGGRWDVQSRGIEPTVVVDVPEGDVLLEDELFGPVLPVVEVEGVEGALRYLEDREHPLVIYAFTDGEEVKKRLESHTTSGTLVFGDTFAQVAINELPFGGVGESGYGRQVLKYSFDNFVYERGVVDVPFGDEPVLAMRYPPYTAESLEFFSAPLKVDIPRD